MAEHFYKVFDSVLADKRLTYPEIILYGVIVRLSMNREKKCFASNQALSEVMRCSKSSISKWLDSLTKCGYISRSVHYAEGTKHIDSADKLKEWSEFNDMAVEIIISNEFQQAFSAEIERRKKLMELPDKHREYLKRQQKYICSNKLKYIV